MPFTRGAHTGSPFTFRTTVTFITSHYTRRVFIYKYAAGSLRKRLDAARHDEACDCEGKWDALNLAERYSQLFALAQNVGIRLFRTKQIAARKSSALFFAPSVCFSRSL